MLRLRVQLVALLLLVALSACASLGGLSGGDSDASADAPRSTIDATRPDASKPDAAAPKHDAAHDSPGPDATTARDAPTSDSGHDAGVDGGFGFSVSAQPSLTLQQGESAPVTVTVTRIGGFSDAITFSVSGLPAAASNNPLTITSDANSGQLTIAVGAATPQSVSHLSIDGVAAGGTVSASANMDLVVRGPPGSLDALFGENGVVSGFLTTTNFGTFDAAGLDANGNVLIAIDSQLGGGQVFVVRILPDGTLDPSFGTGGLATVPNTGVHIEALFPLENGDIELCGMSENGSPWTDEIVYLTPTGAVDTAATVDGGVGESIVRTDGQAYVFTLDPTGRVVETGFTGNATGFLLTRRTTTGALDSTFDAAFASMIAGPGGSTVIQPNGDIVASYAARTAPYGMGLVRTDSSGNLDTTFGTSGVVPATGPGNPSQLLLQPNGDFVAGGVTFSSGGGEMPGGFVARYLPNGTLDITFGSGGVAVISPGNVFAMAQESNLAVDSVGYPWAIGDAGAPTSDLWVERVTAGGLPDVTFGDGGVVSTPIGGAGEVAEGEFVGVLADGRIVVVAAIYKSQGVYDFAVARFWP